MSGIEVSEERLEEDIRALKELEATVEDTQEQELDGSSIERVDSATVEMGVIVPDEEPVPNETVHSFGVVVDGEQVCSFKIGEYGRNRERLENVCKLVGVPVDAASQLLMSEVPVKRTADGWAVDLPESTTVVERVKWRVNRATRKWLHTYDGKEVVQPAWWEALADSGRYYLACAASVLLFWLVTTTQFPVAVGSPAMSYNEYVATTGDPLSVTAWIVAQLVIGIFVAVLLTTALLSTGYMLQDMRTRVGRAGREHGIW